MPNYAQLERNKVLAVYPGAVLEAQGRNWMRHSIGPNRFALDCAIGSYHYHDGTQWQDVDTDWQPTGGAWQYEMRQAAYNAYARNILNAGDLVQYTEPLSGEWVTFQPLGLNWINQDNSRQQLALPQAVTAQVSSDTLNWPNGYGTGRHFKYQTQTDRLGKYFIIDSPANLPAATVTGTIWLELEFIIKNSAGVDLYLDGVKWTRQQGVRVRTSNRIEFRKADGTILWQLAYPTAVDSTGNSIVGQFEVRRGGGTYYITVRIPKTWVDAAIFPITIDPTIDLQVGAGADDGYINHDGGYEAGEFTLTIGQEFTGDQWIRDIWFRFTNVTIAQAATIDVAYFQIRHNSTQTAAILTNIYMNDADDAVAPVDNADYIAKAVTSGVAWDTGATQWDTDTWISSPSIITPVQAVVNRAGWASGNDMMVLWKDDGTPPNTSRNCFAYDFDTTLAAKLHLEYTAGGAVYVPRSGAVNFVDPGVF